MASGPGLVAPPRPQQEGAARKSSRDNSAQQVSMHRHSPGADGARPERSVSRKYSTLAPEGLIGDTAASGLLGISDNHKETETMETV